MGLHRKLNEGRNVLPEERGVSTEGTGNTLKRVLLVGGVLLGLVLAVLLGFRAVSSNPSDTWEQPNDMGEYLSEKTGLRCLLDDEDTGFAKTK